MEAAMVESWMGILIGTLALIIAATAVVRHYRREHRRAELLRNLDQQDWFRWTRSRRWRLRERLITDWPHFFNPMALVNGP
jgi:hypothetical protein